jgi:hypothetical protein
MSRWDLSARELRLAPAGHGYAQPVQRLSISCDQE